MGPAVDEAVQVIVSVVRNVHMLRALENTICRRDQNFWIIVGGNFLNIAAIDWCKLFGSDHEARQPAHWKNTIIASDHDGFRARLLDRLKMTEKEWGDYRAGLVFYRNRNAAHLDLTPPRPTHYPKFDGALEAGYFYYDELAARSEVWPYPKDLKAYAARYLKHSLLMARLATEATSSIDDEVL